MIENIKDFNMLAIYEPTYPVLALANLPRVGGNQPTPCWYEPTYSVLVWTNLLRVGMNQPTPC